MPETNTKEFTATLFPTTEDLTVKQFIPTPTKETPGNVGVCISGGGSRAMTASMGQLRALNYLTLNNQKSLLEQVKAISTVSGGAWLGVPFVYLPSNISDDDYLNTYVPEPSRLVLSDTSGHSTAETLNTFPPGNAGKQLTSLAMSIEGLAWMAFKLWWKQCPTDMLWQSVIGTNILLPYSLYSPSSSMRLPTSLFSYNSQTSKQDVTGPNPSLSKETAHLVATHTHHRPYLICNMSMFIKPTNNDDKKYLAPVQATSFFTGIVGSPDGLDANDRQVGGGGVTSFAFNSVLNNVNGGNVTISQSRQWAIADIVGTSSSFFAKSLKNQIGIWQENPSLFEKFHQQQGPKIIAALRESTPTLDKESHHFLDELEEDVSSIMESLSAFLESIIPAYNYWSVVNAAPNTDMKKNHFADGGNLENTGIGGLLAYSDIDNVISFVNSETPLANSEKGVFNASNQEIPGTRIEVDGQIPPLFGYQPYNDENGYRLYQSDSNPDKPIYKHNQLFPSDAFAELLKGLWETSGNGSNAKPAIYRQNLLVQKNDWFGIKGGKEVGVLWFYLNPVEDWKKALTADVRDFVDGISNFPNYSTLNTQLTAEEVNLMSNLTAWSVANNENAFKKIFTT